MLRNLFLVHQNYKHKGLNFRTKRAYDSNIYTVNRLKIFLPALFRFDFGIFRCKTSKNPGKRYIQTIQLQFHVKIALPFMGVSAVQNNKYSHPSAMFPIPIEYLFNPPIGHCTTTFFPFNRRHYEVGRVFEACTKLAHDSAPKLFSLH